MRHSPVFLAILALCLAMSACATPQQRASTQEGLLAAAGFSVQPANTRDRVASLRNLPSNELVQQDHDGSVRYTYADPLVCHCLYLGDQAAYQRFNQEVADHQLAEGKAQAEQLRQNTWDEHPF